ncbi:RHS repeat-associated core domain-containing protein [Streptomyces sp. Tu6071]|uniref:RHS repeat-associated core domain-containing protein n=1 Tax=Streptomyces sp. Tu6071 TaxID=355249 RepID=UPI000D0AB558|nr:RHS repeat-associated core domain-containing protein [Streptomyces sp. Tu6071]
MIPERCYSGGGVRAAQGDGYDCDSYGTVQTTKETGTAGTQNPYRFVGGTYDRTTGYVKFGQRWYDPTTGRFTTQDKYSFLANPGRGNRYAYAGGDPINNTDPLGLFSFADTVGIVAGGLAGAAGVAVVAGTCALTAGAGCVAGALITGAMWGAGGGALGSTLAGGDSAEKSNGTLGGLVGGATGGLASLLFG